MHLIKRKRLDSEIDSNYEAMAKKTKHLFKIIEFEVKNYENNLTELKNSIQTLEPTRDMKDALGNIVSNLEQVLDNLNGESSDPDCDSSSTSNSTSESSSQ